MPTSVPYALPVIAGIARQIRPATVLDVGIGFGKFGYLFREYLDIWDMETVADYNRDRWKTVIEGIEATPDYVLPLHHQIYDKIHVGDVNEIINTLGEYDVIIMGDVIEHFPKDVGERLLDNLLRHTRKCLILTFPPNCAPNNDVLGNPFEHHRSSWNRRDFRRFANVSYKVFEGRSALVVITKSPHRRPLLTPLFGVRRREGWKGVATAVLVRALGPALASRLASILAGEEVALRG